MTKVNQTMHLPIEFSCFILLLHISFFLLDLMMTFLHDCM